MMNTSRSGSAAAFDPLLLNAALAANPLPQAIIDPRGQTVQASGAWSELMGGEDETWIDRVHPEDLSRLLPLIGSLQGGEAATYRCQLRFRRADGIWSSAEMALTGLGPPYQEILVTAMPSPGTEPVRSALRSSADDERSELAAVLSHDLRQYARLISAYGSLLARGPLDAKQHSQLGVISDQAGRLQQILGSLVRWLRLADEEIAWQSCDIGVLWRAAVTDLVAEIHSGELPVVRGNPQLLQEMLGAVATNAALYHPTRVRLAISAQRRAGFWYLQIDDDGPGIPAAQRERVLRPLHRLHNWEQVPGQGMGLTIAARIAARHGGELLVGESAGGGCRVEIALPAA